jgi:hypothetical protein
MLSAFEELDVEVGGARGSRCAVGSGRLDPGDGACDVADCATTIAAQAKNANVVVSNLFLMCPPMNQNRATQCNLGASDDSAEVCLGTKGPKQLEGHRGMSYPASAGLQRLREARFVFFREAFASAGSRLLSWRRRSTRILFRIVRC